MKEKKITYFNCINPKESYFIRDVLFEECEATHDQEFQVHLQELPVPRMRQIFSSQEAVFSSHSDIIFRTMDL